MLARPPKSAAPGPALRGPALRTPRRRLRRLDPSSGGTWRRRRPVTRSLIARPLHPQACCRRSRRTPSSSRRRGGVSTTTRRRRASSTSPPTCSRAAASTSSMLPAWPRAQRAVLVGPQLAIPAWDARLRAWVAPHTHAPVTAHIGPYQGRSCCAWSHPVVTSRRRRTRHSLLSAQEHRPRADRPASRAPPLARLRAAARRAAQQRHRQARR